MPAITAQALKKLQQFAGSEFIRIACDSSQVILTFDAGEIVVETSVEVESRESNTSLGTISPATFPKLDLTCLFGEEVEYIEFDGENLMIHLPQVVFKIPIAGDGYESISIFFSDPGTRSLFF
ncbi:hypothetical protein [Hyphococcus luteus]|uniref:Uncharacterized protein n=1 Tax=Hyphococcus luteus TaxID=2058213 RepID=A0A2S7K9L8_9PROT|nr:hypothetical protein [Marinicaulis flavus]PQA89214.1 hypothetical protein CW354_04555 [Marinicaulis flavus]